MTVKNEVLKALEENRGSFFSGEVLAQKLNISRAAVWKAINQLKKEGYNINSVSNRGYSLSTDTDMLSKEGIIPYLRDENCKLNIEVYKTIDSTNRKAKQIAVEGDDRINIIISEEQTGGRGRRGRSFYSPQHTGIYMSILIHPDMEMEEATLMTTAASVAVCRALEKTTGIVPSIKWVNDIFLDGRKIAGILTEAVTDFESGKVEGVIIGIGINFLKPENDFPEELNHIAGYIFNKKPKDITRNYVAAEVINEILDMIEGIRTKEFISEYKKRSMVLGKKINILSRDGNKEGEAVDIDDKGALIVKVEGEIVKLNSGEISIRVQ